MKTQKKTFEKTQFERESVKSKRKKINSTKEKYKTKQHWLDTEDEEVYFKVKKRY